VCSPVIRILADTTQGLQTVVIEGDE
jgi:hypothetical protein